MNTQPTGVIVKSVQDGFPIIWKFTNELPSLQLRLKLPHLVVITWNYDKNLNNGMPVTDINEKMNILEDIIEDLLEENDFCKHASSSTGNGRKEFCYYVADTAIFMGFLNEALVGHERYPLEINFYEDSEWSDFKKTLAMTN